MQSIRARRLFGSLLAATLTLASGTLLAARTVAEAPANAKKNPQASQAKASKKAPASKADTRGKTRSAQKSAAKPPSKIAPNISRTPSAKNAAPPKTASIRARTPPSDSKGGAAGAGATSETGPVDPEQAQALREENAAQRQQLKARLDELRQEISAGEATRSEAIDALASSEQAISDTNRKLHDLAKQQSSVQSDLGSLAQRRAAAERTISQQQAGLSKLLRDRYVSGGEDPFKLLFSGDNPNRIARDFEYLGYVSRAQASMLSDLQKSLANLDDLTHQTAQRSQELDSIGQETSTQRAQLLEDEENRKATLAAISEKLQSQRAEAGNLERDDARLAKVVDELGKLIERQAKERAERQRLAQIAHDKERARAEAAAAAAAAAAARQAEEAQRLAEAHSENHSDAHVEAPVARPPVAAPAPPPPATPSSAPANEASQTVALADFQGHFAHLKGTLKLPVKGELVAHFGASRAGGGPSWKGVFIQAATGSEVHAVAPGRVVFAEWLRGFGNLLIIDHGDQYLSIYGNNESLLKQPGDVVQTGDEVATAGNSGGNLETGLYFELRYQGKPFDPLSWTGGR